MKSLVGVWAPGSLALGWAGAVRRELVPARDLTGAVMLGPHVHARGSQPPWVLGKRPGGEPGVGHGLQAGPSRTQAGTVALRMF